MPRSRTAAEVSYFLNFLLKRYRTRSCKPLGVPQLAGKCPKVVGGGLQEGGGWLYYIFHNF